MGANAGKNAEIRAESVRDILRARFEGHPDRHEGIAWEAVERRLEANPEKLSSLAAMEASGGEPDVVGVDAATGEIVFYDCASESPAGRRSLCYDRAALEGRKEARPRDSAADMAAALGGVLADEGQYRDLQRFGPFDQKTSSWLRTPDSVRRLGGALFGDWRYGRAFIYHNGAESYYAARGFRVILKV